jgi:hypothetical protein
MAAEKASDFLSKAVITFFWIPGPDDSDSYLQVLLPLVPASSKKFPLLVFSHFLAPFLDDTTQIVFLLS